MRIEEAAKVVVAVGEKQEGEGRTSSFAVVQGGVAGEELMLAGEDRKVFVVGEAVLKMKCWD